MDQLPETISSFTELTDKYDTFIFDCDGVLWHTGLKLDKAFETLNALKEQGKKIFFLTNTSTKSRKKYAQKIHSFGFETTVNQIYPSSYVAPAYIKLHYPEVKKLYIVGMEGLIEETLAAGFSVVGGPEDNTKRLNTENEFTQMPLEREIDAILVGFDMDFNYYKLVYASACLQKGAMFFATNGDPYDMAGDMRLPTAGAMLASIQQAADRTPIVMGKPNKYAIDLIVEQHGVDKKRCLMIGDRVDTDVQIGKNAGIDTCLVLSGVTNPEMLENELKKKDAVVPNYVCKAVCLE